MKEQITYKDLSWPCKVAVVESWIRLSILGALVFIGIIAVIFGL